MESLQAVCRWWERPEENQTGLKAIASLMITLYKCSEQKSISACTKYQTLRQSEAMIDSLAQTGQLNMMVFSCCSPFTSRCDVFCLLRSFFAQHICERGITCVLPLSLVAALTNLSIYHRRLKWTMHFLSRNCHLIKALCWVWEEQQFLKYPIQPMGYQAACHNHKDHTFSSI